MPCQKLNLNLFFRCTQTLWKCATFALNYIFDWTFETCLTATYTWFSCLCQWHKIFTFWYIHTWICREWFPSASWYSQQPCTWPIWRRTSLTKWSLQECFSWWTVMSMGCAQPKSFSTCSRSVTRNQTHLMLPSLVWPCTIHTGPCCWKKGYADRLQR